MSKLRIVCISDTHTKHRDIDYIPEGDVLIHSGDITFTGHYSDIKSFNTWLGKLDFKHKIVIAGNHDLTFEYRWFPRFAITGDPKKAEECLTNCTYLNNSGCEIEGFKFWGSPWTPWFYDWAFNAERGEEIKKHWDLIPKNTDVLITHGPVNGLLDEVETFGSTNYGQNVGCEDLKKAIFNKIKPMLHVCGHIHEGYGQTEVDGIKFVNASICDKNYNPCNDPIVIDLEKK